MDIIFYDAKNIKEDYIYAKHNCVIKPNVNDCVSIKNKFYKVISCSIDYESNTIHVFVEKLREKKKFWR